MVRYTPEGFELDLQGLSGEKAFDEVYNALKELREAAVPDAV